MLVQRLLCPACHTQTGNHSHQIGNGGRRRQSHIAPFTHFKGCKKILAESDKPYICEACNCENYTQEDGIWLWMDLPIKLECNHIDGRSIVDADNVENLVSLM